MAPGEYASAVFDRALTYEVTLRVTVVSECSLEHASGVTNSVVQMARCLEADGHAVTVICPSPAPATLGNAEVIATKSVNLRGFDVGQCSRKKLKELFRSLDPDIVHAASPMRTPKAMGLFIGANAVRAADKLDIATTAVYQTDSVRFAKHLGLDLAGSAVKKQVRKAHKRSDLNLVPSSSSETDLIEWGVDPATIRRWGRGIDTSLFSPERRSSEAVATLRSQWAPNGEVIIGIVSRLEPEKRIHKLAVLSDIPGTRIVVVGKGTRRRKLESVLGDRAIFTGRLDGDDLANAFAAIDIFPFPSTVDTFGQVIQEAKASGLSIVAANRGGPKDLIRHGETGYLYEPSSKRSPDTELRVYVERLVEDQALRHRIGRAARSSVEDRTWDVLYGELIGHYQESIDLRAAKGSTSSAVGR